MEHEMSMDGLVHDAERLKELQALPLSRKILITQARIIEFVERMGGPDNVFVSLSGKDSTVLLHIARQIYPTIKAVFADTGLEFPENRRSAVMYGADIVRPKARFADVVSEYGYPLIGKEVAEAIYYARKIRPAESNDIVKTGGGQRQSQSAPRCPHTIAKRAEMVGSRRTQHGFGGKSPV